MHYAAYNSLKDLLVYLLDKDANAYYCNHVTDASIKRGLTPVDVATPEIREWLIRRDI